MPVRLRYLAILRLILVSGSESNSENSSHEDFTEHKVIVQINNQDRDVEVTHL